MIAGMSLRDKEDELIEEKSVIKHVVNGLTIRILQGLVQLYLDNLLIAAKTEHENLEKLKQAFKIAEQNCLLINFEKCKFLKSNILFLGYRIGGGKIRPSEGKLLAVKNFPAPKSVKQVQSLCRGLSYPADGVTRLPLNGRTRTSLDAPLGRTIACRSRAYALDLHRNSHD